MYDVNGIAVLNFDARLPSVPAENAEMISKSSSATASGEWNYPPELCPLAIGTSQNN